MPRRDKTPPNPRKSRSPAGRRQPKPQVDCSGRPLWRPSNGAKGNTAANLYKSASPVSVSSRRFRLILAGICGLGLLLRLVILDEYVRENPFADNPPSDAAIYWQMGAEMAAGNWIGDTPFLSAPLYPYLLGVLRVLGGGLLSAYVVQTLIHLGTAVLIAWVTRLRFGALAGLFAAGLFLALTEPAVSTARILAGTLQLLLAALLWWRWGVLAERGPQRWPDLVVVGGLIGLLALSYPPALLLVVVYGLWLWWAGGRRGPAARRALVGLLCSVATIAPATLHNAWGFGEFIPISAHAGITLLQGNSEAADGTYTAVPGVSAGRALMHQSAAEVFKQDRGRKGTWREIDQYMRQRVYTFWSQHPGLTVKLFARKAYWYLTARNYHDIMPPVVERHHGVADRTILAPLPTPWLFGAAAAGLIGVLRRPVRFAPEWSLFALPLLVVVLFFYTPRYRQPAIPVVCGLAACALAHYRRLGYPRSVVVGLCLLPLPLAGLNSLAGFDERETMLKSYSHFLSAAQVHVGSRRSAEGDLAAAENRFKAALRAYPSNAVAHRELGALYARLGRPHDAIANLELAIRSHEEDERFRYPGWQISAELIYRYLCNVYLDLKRYRDAAEALREAIRLRPDVIETRLALAWMLATCPQDTLRNGAEAVEHAQTAGRLTSRELADVQEVLAAAYAEAGRFDDAIAAAISAAELARRDGKDQQADEIESHLALYRDHQPCRAAPRPARVPALQR